MSQDSSILISEPQIEGFAKHYQYDASFLKFLLHEAPEAFEAYCHFAVMNRFRGCLPPEARFVAKVTAMMTEDCGPCTQLNVRMAREAGVSAGILRATLGQGGELPEDLRRVQEYTRGVATNQLREGLVEIMRAAYGNEGLADLALCIASARVYPCLKRGLGFAGKSCDLVEIEA